MEYTKRARYARETITPSGHFGNSPDNVVELENMVTTEEQEYLLNFARNNTTWDVTESQWNENGNIKEMIHFPIFRNKTNYGSKKNEKNAISFSYHAT